MDHTRKKIMNLTEKETELFQAIQAGMDEPGCGWLHEFAPQTHSTSGVVGSLVKKELIHADVEKEPGMPPMTWVSLASMEDPYAWSS